MAWGNKPGAVAGMSNPKQRIAAIIAEKQKNGMVGGTGVPKPMTGVPRVKQPKVYGAALPKAFFGQ